MKRFVFGLLISATALPLFAAEKNAAEKNDAEAAKPAATAKNSTPPAGVQMEGRISADLKYLSADDRQGRGIGTKGLDQAADFIASEFKKAGLNTAVIDGQPFQSFEMPVRTEMGPAEDNQLTFSYQNDGSDDGSDGKPHNIALKLGDDFNPLSLGASGKFNAPLVFAGYGISAPGIKYDDYADIDVKGKVVIAIRKMPGASDKKSLFNQGQNRRHAFFFSKVAAAEKHGAAALILVNDAGELATRRGKTQQNIENQIALLAKETAAYQKIDKSKEDESKEDERNKQRGKIVAASARLKELSDQLAAGFDQPLTINQAGGRGGSDKLPVIFATRAAIDRILKQSAGKLLADLEDGIEKEIKPASFVLKNSTAAGATSVNKITATVKNVIGVLEGEGPLADETVVIGAHYDHLGSGATGGSLAPWTTAVHNGADDNGSGTVSLLETARHFAAAGKPPRRMVFIAFTAEERGLVGSRHYVSKPVFPLKDTVAMINMDMVGRLKDNKLLVHGVGTAKEFIPLVEKHNKKHGFLITPEPAGQGPSDHASFYSAKVPVLHVFTGLHNDYHRPSDDFEKVNVTGIRRITSFVNDLTTEIAAGKRPQYQETKRPAKFRGKP